MGKKPKNWAKRQRRYQAWHKKEKRMFRIFGGYENYIIEDCDNPQQMDHHKYDLIISRIPWGVGIKKKLLKIKH